VRVRRVVAAVAVVGLAASGCSSEPASGELELEGDDAAAAPVEPDPPVEVTDEPSDPPGDEEQLYPPLPPLEPDPNSDVSIEDQKFFLNIYREAYEAIESALATNRVDEQALGRLLVESEVEAIVATVEQRVREGTQLRSPDAEVRWAEVTDAHGGEAVVQDCRVSGPLTGSYDVASGVKVGASAAGARIVEFLLSPIDVDGDVAYRVAGIRSGEDPERCGA
jgi:hypothetical protein